MDRNQRRQARDLERKTRAVKSQGGVVLTHHEDGVEICEVRIVPAKGGAVLFETTQTPRHAPTEQEPERMVLAREAVPYVISEGESIDAIKARKRELPGCPEDYVRIRDGRFDDAVDAYFRQRSSAAVVVQARGEEE